MQGGRRTNQRELRTDTKTREQYIESTVEDIEAAFTLLETTLLKKSNKTEQRLPQLFLNF